MNRLQRLVEVFVAIATDIKAITNKIGNLTQLTTTNKVDLVQAINELVAPKDDATYVQKNGTWVKNNPTDVIATNFGVKVDARRLLDVVKITNSNTISSVTGNFTQDDIGKRVRIYNITTSTYVGTSAIATVTSAQEIVLQDVLAAAVDVGHKSVCWIGTDNFTNLQAVLDAAGVVARSATLLTESVIPQRLGHVMVTIPVTDSGSGCLISASITIPAGVTLNTGAMLVSDCGLSSISNRVWPVYVSVGASIQRLSLDAMWGMGVKFGDNTQYSRTTIETVEVSNVGTDYDTNLSVPEHIGIMFSGLSWSIGNLWVSGGRVGVKVSGGVYINADSVHCVRSVNALQVLDSEQVHFKKVILETVSNTGVSVDNVSSLTMDVHAVTNTNEFPTSVMVYGVKLGDVSSTSTRNKNVHVEYTSQATGNTAVKVSNTADSSIKCNLSNERLNINSSQINPTTIGVEFGAGNFGYLNTQINLSTSLNSGSDSNTIITAYSGVRYGMISINNRDIDSTPITISSIEPASPTINQLWLDIS